MIAPPAPFGLPRLPDSLEDWLAAASFEGRYLIYGAGVHTRALLDLLRRRPGGALPVALVDRRAAELGVVDGIRVIAPDALPAWSFERILVSFDRDEGEIVDFLLGLGVPLDRIQVIYADPGFRARRAAFDANTLLNAVNGRQCRRVVILGRPEPAVAPEALALALPDALLIDLRAGSSRSPETAPDWPAPVIRLHPWEAAVTPALLRQLGRPPTYLALGGRLSALAGFDGLPAACERLVVEAGRDIPASVPADLIVDDCDDGHDRMGRLSWFTGLGVAPRVLDLGQVERARFGDADRTKGPALVWLDDLSTAPSASRPLIDPLLAQAPGLTIDHIHPDAADAPPERIFPPPERDFDGRVLRYRLRSIAARRLVRLFDGAVIPPSDDPHRAQRVSWAFTTLIEAGVPVIIDRGWTRMADLVARRDAGIVVDNWGADLPSLAWRDGFLNRYRPGVERLRDHMLNANRAALARIAAALDASG